MDLNFLGSLGAWVVAHGGETIVGLTALVTFFSVVANFTKTDADNKVVAVISNVVHWLALNVVKPKPPSA